MSNIDPRQPTSAMREVFSVLARMKGSAPADQCGDMRTLNALAMRGYIRIFEMRGRIWVSRT